MDSYTTGRHHHYTNISAFRAKQFKYCVLLINCFENTLISATPLNYSSDISCHCFKQNGETEETLDT